MGELSWNSLKLAAEYYFTDRQGEKKGTSTECSILNIYDHPEIGKEVASVVGVFHNELGGELRNGEKGRRQRIPLTLDDMARVSDCLLESQVRDRATGRLDLVGTLTRALEFYYLDRLADAELKERMKRSLRQIFTGDTGKIRFRGEIKTRKEVLDALVYEATVTGEEKARVESEDRERQKTELLQSRSDFKDILDALGKNPDIPGELKEVLA